MKDFADKVVVITGAGSGMGRAYALEFARLGSRVVLSDVDTVALDETLRLLEKAGTPAALSGVYDVSDRDATYDFAAQVDRELGGAHVIINNAGISGGGRSVLDATDEDFERVMAINFTGVLHGTRAFLPQLLARGEGAVVNVSSIFGLVGTPHNGDYCAAKFAVRGLTEALMVELLETPVTVHLVHPGGIATNIVRTEEGRAFAEKFLTTPPEAIARRLVEAIRKDEPRLVYGNGARKTWFGARFVPRKVLTRMLWREIMPTMQRD